jgi:glycosyltransferase involved in cell wall biosynthesis
MNVYEVDKIIQNGVNGFVSDNIDELRGYVRMLLDKPLEAKRIGEAGRKTAIELFDKEPPIPGVEVIL